MNPNCSLEIKFSLALADIWFHEFANRCQAKLVDNNIFVTFFENGRDARCFPICWEFLILKRLIEYFCDQIGDMVDKLS